MVDQLDEVVEKNDFKLPCPNGFLMLLFLKLQQFTSEESVTGRTKQVMGVSVEVQERAELQPASNDLFSLSLFPLHMQTIFYCISQPIDPYFLSKSNDLPAA